MDIGELRELLTSHSSALRALGAEVDELDVAGLATDAEVDTVERQLGVRLPESLRWVFTSMSRAVTWGWRTDVNFPPPFDDIFSGALSWSLDDLVELQLGHQTWVTECFPNADDPYDKIWHNKVCIHAVPNGDEIAVDLAAASSGQITYLSHELDDSHGYVLADSLGDLLDRWAPLACPGSEDWQWLPFVPWDEGPIDPACTNGRRWIELIGLSPNSIRTPPSRPTADHINGLLASFRAAPFSDEGRRSGRRAVKCCGPERVSDVLDLLRAGDGQIQELAANRLGDWQAPATIPDLAAAARTAGHNGRLAAIRALQKIPGAGSALDVLRRELGSDWVK